VKILKIANEALVRAGGGLVKHGELNGKGNGYSSRT
jgi:hypothetical protein